jgi:hypothetical protein
MEKTMNPPITINSYQVKENITVNVIRDDLLPGGTKQRALTKFIEYYPEYNEFIYCGTSSGFAQVALTIACREMNKQATLFLTNSPKHAPYLSLWCQKKGANVTIYQEKLSIIEQKAKNYANEDISKRCLLPFGLDSATYNDFLYTQLLEAIPPEIKPKRLWITVGSGTLLRVLANIWPETEFMPVQVGKKIWEDQYTPDLWKRIGGYDRINKLKAPQNFFTSVPCKLLPPYPSVSNYDAKIWQHVLKYAEDGDWVWNIASDETIIKEMKDTV